MGILLSFSVMALAGFYVSPVDATNICGTEICKNKMSNEEKIAKYMTIMGETQPSHIEESNMTSDIATIESLKQQINKKHQEIDELSVQLFELTGEPEGTDSRSNAYQQACSPKSDPAPEPKCAKFSGGIGQRMDMETCTDE